MVAETERRHHDRGLLKFWAFFLTAMHCVLGLFGVTILLSVLQANGRELYLVQCAVGGLLFGMALVSVVAYFGVLRSASWSRLPLLVVAWFSLILFPLGTGLAIMILHILLGGPRPHVLSSEDERLVQEGKGLPNNAATRKPEAS